MTPAAGPKAMAAAGPDSGAAAAPGLEWRVEDGIGRIILDDPPANVMSLAVFDGLHRIIAGIPESGVKAVVVHGRGRHFSQGADLDELVDAIAAAGPGGDNAAAAGPAALPEADPGELPDFIRRNNETFLALRSLGIPVIAAVTGICLGSALELVLSCGIRLCGRGTVFALPESEFSLMPGCGGINALVRDVRLPVAIELILRGRRFSAEEALDWGIVDAVTDKRKTVDEAVALARRLAAGREGAA